MSTAQASVAVDRSIEDVFRFLAEGKNNPLWRPDVRLAAQVGGTPGAPGIGVTYFQKVTDRAHADVDETYQITRYEAPQLLEFVATRGSTRILGRYRLVVINTTTTHVDFSLERLSPEFRREQRRNYISELQDRVDAITNLPGAMGDRAIPR